MDARTAAIINGYTDVLVELIHLLVNKRLLSQGEVRDTIARVLVRGIERGAQLGFDEVPVVLLKTIDSWESAPH